MKLLIVATSHACPCALGHPTGLWLEELAVPFYAFAGAGFEVEIASVAGGPVPLDPVGLELTADTPEEVGRFVTDPAARDLIGASQQIASIDADSYGAVFLPGGYGAMSDLPGCRPLAELLSRCLAARRPVAAVGHGLAGLVGSGEVAGRRITCFSNAEEASLGLSEYVPFLLEDRLRALGAVVETGPEFKPFLIRDGNLITGQNPASTALVTEAVLGLLAIGAQAVR